MISSPSHPPIQHWMLKVFFSASVIGGQSLDAWLRQSDIVFDILPAYAQLAQRSTPAIGGKVQLKLTPLDRPVIPRLSLQSERLVLVGRGVECASFYDLVAFAAIYREQRLGVPVIALDIVHQAMDYVFRLCQEGEKTVIRAVSELSTGDSLALARVGARESYSAMIPSSGR